MPPKLRSNIQIVWKIPGKSGKIENSSKRILKIGSLYGKLVNIRTV